MTDTRPKTKSSLAEKEMDSLQKQFDDQQQQIESLTLDRMNEAPKREVEQQTKIALADIDKSNDVYLKPNRAISSKEKFNERFRSDYDYAKEYVHFIAENKEIIGESIEMWTKPFPGMPAEYWIVPTNKALWAPRYVAERIKGCSHHRLVMKNDMKTGSDHMGQYTGGMVADETIQRLDAIPVSKKRSIFMGSGAFA